MSQWNLNTFDIPLGLQEAYGSRKCMKHDEAVSVPSSISEPRLAALSNTPSVALHPWRCSWTRKGEAHEKAQALVSTVLTFMFPHLFFSEGERRSRMFFFSCFVVIVL